MWQEGRNKRKIEKRGENKNRKHADKIGEKKRI
jgi:hypothetical protein